MINPFSKFKEYYKKMKTVRLLAVSFIFAAIFAVSAFAQAGGQPGTAKIVVIDTGAFAGDEKGLNGINKFITAMKSLNDEFKVVQTELDTMSNRLQTLAAEIEKMRNPPQGVPVNTSTLQTKIDEAQTLDRDLKRKQEDAQSKYERRRQVVMGPLMQDISKSLQDFAKLKGYDLILDAARLDAQQMILGFVPDRVDVTKEFIIYYNARPAGAATASAPK